MSYSIEQLSAFVAAVEHGGISQAARASRLHASTVRDRIQNLELDTGLQLFTRHARSLELTNDGRALYQSAMNVLNEHAFFDSQVKSLLDGAPSSLTLAVDTALREQGGDRALQALVEQFPQIALKVITADTLQIRDWIMAGKADMGYLLTTLTYPSELVCARVRQLEICRVIAAECFPSGELTPETLRTIRQLTLSLPIQIGLTAGDIIAHRVFESNDPFQVLQMVRMGMGFAHLPRVMCQSDLDSGDLKLLEIEQESPSRWGADVIWQAQRVLDPGMTLILETLQKDSHSSS